MADETNKYSLHKAVFENDLQGLSRLLRKHDVATKDKHGKLINCCLLLLINWGYVLFTLFPFKLY